ncbi:hypothetical protein [Nesterenkonia pannonica]|uniref:hypothetical protein n=1 Tax=Nesterenkonia pannonica TaxID=1548602 RepID=UPI002164368D|nr:hypothetical protein [Nesterenkonia pannonica]
MGGLQKKIASGTITGPTSPDVQMVFQDAGSSLTPWMTVRRCCSSASPQRGRGREAGAHR